MATDEAGTYAEMKAIRREIVDPAAGRNGGRIFKSTGDGVLAEFHSAVDAVECALDIQAALAERNAGVPVERRLLLRIGISLGDVIVDVAALALILTPDERKRLTARGTESFEAYDLFLRGRELVWKQAKAESIAGRELLRRAIALDPGFGKAYAFLAFALTQFYINAWVDDPDAVLAEARSLADKAVKVAPDDPECRFVRSIVLQWQRDHDGSLREVEECLRLEPSSALGHLQLGALHTYAGRPREAIAAIHEAMRYDLQTPEIHLQFLATAHFNMEEYEEAETLLRRRIARNPHTDVANVLLAATLGHLGRVDEGKAAWDAALAVNPNYSFERRRRILPFRDPSDLERVAEGLRKAGVPV